ncbi:sporulation membrane protein YtaF [Aetokthonos hydrillicola Thurmond2011]|jgi:putative sporulation protein YtaF|uniref:Sporulation membrane protein YtaF n=1 Tax=Aetokthonos hydrillicola Thurmond2011 TaxID=2712845 RepID=A0AAP5M961_9CYAN|nr:sporulation membrane protein YtaF [Aetokthonos hydrillicola]MBO3459273.1 sporulation membrane protein YtaF [Aetokthonos hydrillicola CCALA 1050]MBW4590583.1 sporulation membrane protein YtaF [Aetokthonos hydrillicola CCALA 1050]MDR9894348.1 sporulation membrane protein YtaF [Aetokthonos hydrillicola Thurmond2011]
MGHHLLSSVFLALSSNVDNFAIGIAYGVKRIKIGISGNFIIAIFSSLGTYCSMSIGAILAKFLSHNLANLLGSGALVAIGIWGIWDAIITERKEKRRKNKSSVNELSYTTFINEPERADLDKSRLIDVRESLTLAFALTINNIAGGVGAGLSGVNIFITTYLTFVLSITAIFFGYFLGARFTAQMSGKITGILSGCLIICIGIYEYFSLIRQKPHV